MTMECKECGNTIDDIAFIGGLCIDCYDLKLNPPRVRITERVSSAIRKATEKQATKGEDEE